MSGNTISITMTSDDRDVVKSFTDQNAQIIRNQEALKKMGAAGRRSGQETKSGLDEAKSSAVSVASSVGLITSGVGLATAAVRTLIAEFQDLERRQDRAYRTQVDFATAVKQAILNAPDQTPAQVEATVQRISEATGASPRDAALAYSSAASAKGKLSPADAEEATREALRLTADLPDAQGTFAGVALDIRNLFPKAKAKDALGFSLALGSQARVVNPGDIAENLVPGAVDLARQGSSLRDAAGAIASITFGSGDTTGRSSRTAAIALDAQLRGAFPDIKGGIGEQISFLQNDPDARKAFFEGGKFEGREVKAATFEKRAQGAIEALLTAGSDVDQTYRNALKNLPELTAAGDIFEKRVQEIRGARSQTVAQVDRETGAAAERARIANEEAGGAGVARKSLEEVLESVGDGATARILQSLRLRARGGGLVNQRDILEERQDDIRGIGLGGPPKTLTAQDTRNLNTLQQAIDSLTEAIDTQNRNAAQNGGAQKVEVVNDPVVERGKANRKLPAAANSRQ